MDTRPNRRLRCAIYTRKSSEEGLDMEFNSLDAQREACEAYIASQKSEGWVATRERYDDGGFSGGNLDRPGLKQLLTDIDDGLIDVVVVYKIDRLSRSLMDFSKLVEVFDRNGVTFVSVTQSFNTTTSMGRLTLNILLSFAQFEREVIGERIRDKVAASRKRGIWMGGYVPLGYYVQDRKLIVNEVEAANVRRIFQRFIDLGSATMMARVLRGEGFRNRDCGICRFGNILAHGRLRRICRCGLRGWPCRSGIQQRGGQRGDRAGQGGRRCGGRILIDGLGLRRWRLGRQGDRQTNRQDLAVCRNRQCRRCRHQQARLGHRRVLGRPRS